MCDQIVVGAPKWPSFLCRVGVMSLSAERKLDFEEAFEIIGKKASTINKDTMAVILRSLGLNPTNDEVTELFNKVSSGGVVDVNGVLAAAGEFEATMINSSQGELQQAFGVFDKDNTGKISSACVSSCRTTVLLHRRGSLVTLRARLRVCVCVPLRAQ